MRNPWWSALVGTALVVASACGSGLGGEDGATGGTFGDAGPIPGNGGNGASAPLGPSDGLNTAPGQADPAQRSTGGAGGSGGSSLADDGGADAEPPKLCPGRAQEPQAVLATLAGANVSAAAPAAREIVRTLGQSPLPADLRTQDFINYYAPSFPEPSTPEPQVHVQLHKSAIVPYYDLMVAVRAPVPATRAPLELTVLVDNTESLGDAGLARAKAALAALASGLGEPGDQLTLVTLTPDEKPATFALPTDAGALSQALDALALAPEAAVENLIATGYQHAQQNVQDGADTRVVLLSDGEGNPDNLPADIAAAAANQGIRFVAIGTGPAVRFGHRLLRTASRQGRGPYVYLDSEDEAATLSQRLHELFGVAFDQLSVNVTVPWYFDVERPTPGEQATPGTVEDQYLAPGKSAVFLFRLVACDPDAPFIAPELVVATARYAAPANVAPEVTKKIDTASLLQGPTAELAKAFAVFTYAEALGTLDAKRLAYAHGIVQQAIGLQIQGDPELDDIAKLLTEHPAYSVAPQ